MKFTIAFVLAALFLSNPGFTRGASDPAEFDLSVGRMHYLEPTGMHILPWPAPEVDSYWIDSWTADGDGWLWYTPELYTFSKGMTVEAVLFYVQTSGEYDFIRYDGFYFCGELNPKHYIFYGWADFGWIPPPPNYGWITGLSYDTSSIPDRLLPLNLDWASKCIVSTGWFAGGVPLPGRPDCFTIEK